MRSRTVIAGAVALALSARLLSAQSGPPVTGAPTATSAVCPALPAALPPALYVSECSGRLWRIDPATGAATNIGLLTDGVRTFAGYDLGITTDGYLFGTTGSEIFCADVTTAAAQSVGPATNTSNLNGLTGASGGRLLGIDQGGFPTPASLFAIDRATGAATAVGPLNGCGPSSGDLASRPSDGRLFAVLACAPDKLVVLDPATGGVITTVGPVIDGLGMPRSDVYGMGFDSCNRLYATAGTRLLQLDAGTGRAIADVAIVPVAPSPPFTQACGLAALVDRPCALAVRFAFVAAYRMERGGVEVAWATELEEDTNGFGVERATAAAGPYAVIAWIDARGGGSRYAYRDPEADGDSPWYRLVEYTGAGRGEVTAPFQAGAAGPAVPPPGAAASSGQRSRSGRR